MADHIGTGKALVENEPIDDIIKAYDSHESIVKIRLHINCDNLFSFEETNDHEVYKLLHDIDVKKATEYDGIPPPPKNKLSAHELCKPITNTINLSIKASCFSKQLKLAEVSPMF